MTAGPSPRARRWTRAGQAWPVAASVVAVVLVAVATTTGVARPARLATSLSATLVCLAAALRDRRAGPGLAVAGAMSLLLGVRDLSELSGSRAPYLLALLVVPVLVVTLVRDHRLRRAAQAAERSQRLAVLQSAERERRRWAHELHDDTLQELAGLRLRLGRARRSIGSTAAQQVLGQACADLDRMIADLRRLVADMRPVLLDELGLLPALETLVERTESTSRLAVQLDWSGSTCRLRPDLEQVVYRFVQEALTNVVRHARASRAVVSLECHAAGARVRVSDDGVGMPTGGAVGLGLLGLRERVRLAGGRLSIRAGETGRGTTVEAILPGEPAEAEGAEPQD